MEKLDILTGCGAGESFPSAHAANHFALAVFLGLTCFAERPILKWCGIAWAFSIALGQVYVGRHYLSDIAAGALLGTLIAYCTSALYHRYLIRRDQLTLD